MNMNALAVTLSQQLQQYSVVPRLDQPDQVYVLNRILLAITNSITSYRILLTITVSQQL